MIKNELCPFWMKNSQKSFHSDSGLPKKYQKFDLFQKKEKLFSNEEHY
jgi:hypothetical protein